MTQPAFLSIASGQEKQDIDRRVVSKTKKGGSEREKKSHNSLVVHDKSVIPVVADTQTLGPFHNVP